MKKLFSVFLTALLILSIAGCNSNENANKNNSFTIVCTEFPQYDFVRELTKSTNINPVLLNKQSDLHSFEPTANDIIQIKSCNIFIYNDTASEPWVEDLLKTTKNVFTFSMMSAVKALNEETVDGMQEEHGDNETEIDEHVWLSLKNAVKITEAFKNIIIAASPKNEAKINENFDNYKTKLLNLDEKYQNTIKSSPKKTLIFGDRFPFRYLTEDYGLNYFAAFSGCSSETEASFDTITFLIEKANEINAKVILSVDGSDGSVANTIAKSVGAKVLMLNSCQSITETDIEKGANYYDIMLSDLEVIKEALS